jgi:hypothetical protein
MILQRGWVMGWLVGVACCAVAAGLNGQEKSPAKLNDAAPSAAQTDLVDRLVKRLGDSDYRVREKATETLEQLDAESRPMLLKHLESARVAEVQFRLRRATATTAAELRPVETLLLVSDYFVAVCDGNEEAARQCLTRETLEDVDMQGLPLQPPVASFVGFCVLDATMKDPMSTAYVRTQWQTRTKQGQLNSVVYITILKRTQAGWRISATMDSTEFRECCAL